MSMLVMTNDATDKMLTSYAKYLVKDKNGSIYCGNTALPPIHIYWVDLTKQKGLGLNIYKTLSGVRIEGSSLSAIERGHIYFTSKNMGKYPVRVLCPYRIFDPETSSLLKDLRWSKQHEHSCGFTINDDVSFQSFVQRIKAAGASIDTTGQDDETLLLEWEKEVTEATDLFGLADAAAKNETRSISDRYSDIYTALVTLRDKANILARLQKRLDTWLSMNSYHDKHPQDTSKIRSFMELRVGTDQKTLQKQIKKIEGLLLYTKSLYENSAVPSYSLEEIVQLLVQNYPMLSRVSVHSENDDDKSLYALQVSIHDSVLLLCTDGTYSFRGNLAGVKTSEKQIDVHSQIGSDEAQGTLGANRYMSIGESDD